MGEKLTGTALTLIGVVNLLTSIGAIYLLISVGGFLDILIQMYEIPISSFMGTIDALVKAGWAFTLLGLATGLVTLAAGVSILTKPKQTSLKKLSQKL